MPEAATTKPAHADGSVPGVPVPELHASPGLAQGLEVLLKRSHLQHPRFDLIDVQHQAWL